jgi:hypothetical protein
MKKLAILLLVAVLWNSCSNEFELTEEWKDIPIVYGLLSMADTAQYIRVERAYLDPNTSALAQAKIADSIYYENASVQIVHEQTGDVYDLEMIDGRDDGYFREEGVFAQEPNYLFKIRTSDIDLIGGDDYRLELDRGNGNPIVTSQTALVDEFVLFRPLSGTSLRFEDGLNFTFSWREIESAAFYDVTLEFNYTEQDPNQPGNPFISKRVIWKVAENIRTNEYRIQGEEFYQAIASGIEGGLNVPRRIGQLSVVIEAGGTSLFDFIQVGSANQGITGSLDLPEFSNLSEGLGVFSSRNEIREDGFNLFTATRDSLEFGRFTRDLNF